MTSRSCVYKDCDYSYSVHDSAATKGPWTIFSFPKHPHRARIWFDNAQVNPKIPHTQLFICSKHFDTKFISSTKNRTMLVGEAIPFPYKKNKKDPDSDAEYVKMVSGAEEKYYINISDNELHELTVEKIVSTSNEPKTAMVQTIEINMESPTAKRSKKQTSAPPVPAEPSSLETCSSADSDPDNMETIDTSEVSMFKFKGEEYVQMSMEFYMREKRKMAELLKEYRKALRSIKDQVSRLDV